MSNQAQLESVHTGPLSWDRSFACAVDPDRLDHPTARAHLLRTGAGGVPCPT
jgi:hypothetical protein